MGHGVLAFQLRMTRASLTRLKPRSMPERGSWRLRSIPNAADGGHARDDCLVGARRLFRRVQLPAQSGSSFSSSGWNEADLADSRGDGMREVVDVFAPDRALPHCRRR